MNRGARISTATIGAVFGSLLTASGFGNYTTIHQALLLRSWYLYAVFGSALVVAAAGPARLRRSATTVFGGPLRLPHRPPGHGTSTAPPGAGFGLTGTCPGSAIATGGLGGLLVLAGLIAWLRLRGLTEPAPAAQHPGAIPEQPERVPPLTAGHH